MADLAPRRRRRGVSWRVSRYPDQPLAGRPLRRPLAQARFPPARARRRSRSTIAGRSAQLGWLDELRSDVIAYRWADARATSCRCSAAVSPPSEDEISPTVHTVTMSATDYRGCSPVQALRSAVSPTRRPSSSRSLGRSSPPAISRPASRAGRLGLSTATLGPDGSPLAATGVVQDRTLPPGPGRRVGAR